MLTHSSTLCYVSIQFLEIETPKSILPPHSWLDLMPAISADDIAYFSINIWRILLGQIEPVSKTLCYKTDLHPSHLGGLEESVAVKSAATIDQMVGMKKPDYKARQGL